MIISASRRTDIPNYYSEWLFNRIREGFVLVRNPVNPRQISKVSLSPRAVDCFVFWTKNPTPMFHRLDEIGDFPYYFQFTLNSYEKDLEPGLPSKKDGIIPAFRQLSKKIGAQRVLWRYDPILLNRKYTVKYHQEHFREIVEKLEGFTNRCTISFLDSYRKTERNARELGFIDIQPETMREIAASFSETAQQHGIRLETCCEKIDLGNFNISHARCIDPDLIETLMGCPIKVRKDPSQRMECGCAASIDIGAYHTCQNGCKYCYATISPQAAQKNALLHNPVSPLLIGSVADGDLIHERPARSLRNNQLQF